MKFSGNLQYLLSNVYSYPDGDHSQNLMVSKLYHDPPFDFFSMKFQTLVFA